MATNNHARWLGNLDGEPAPAMGAGMCLGKFQAGATQAIKAGELLELSGGNFIPLDADQAMTSIIAVAAEEIKSGDRAGYYMIFCPRPGDVFEYALAAAANPAIGDSLYWSSSEVVTVTAGTNILGYVATQDHYPHKQGHTADDASGDAGTTIRNTARVGIVFKKSVAYRNIFA